MTYNLKKITPYLYEVPKTGDMRVPGRIYTDENLLPFILKEDAVKQVANAAKLPGIVKASLAMPDIHSGYGFPIGGVAAFDPEEGIVSPGGVGYDINCGVRLAGTRLDEAAVRSEIKDLADALYRHIPTGVGSTGNVKLNIKNEKKVLVEGALWAVKNGFGSEEDLLYTEDGGSLPMADPDVLSDRALERGKKQLGTLGSGNHFLELGVIEEIFHDKAAKAFGLSEGMVTLMLHTGSRGLGYQVCDDALGKLARFSQKKGVIPPDRQLVYAPVQSPEAREYFAAMACAANYAWANRQVLMSKAGEVLMHVLGMGPKELGLTLVYDVCHNIAKMENHIVDGKKQTLCVHRKGATRAFGPGSDSLNEAYRHVGQPVLIPGDMGTASYVLLGTQKAMEVSFGSTCHGAGRILSRTAAKKAAKGRSIHRELEDKGIVVRWTGRSTLSEEMPEAYKNISQVVEVVHQAGISKKVAKIRPILVIKG